MGSLIVGIVESARDPRRVIRHYLRAEYKDYGAIF